MALKIYDPDQAVVELAGIRIQGFADGEYVTAEMLTDTFQDVVGTDGEVTRSKSNDLRCTVTVKLMHTSSTNPALSALLLLDINAPNGAGVGPFSLVDNSTPQSAGTPLIIAEQAWITRPPNLSRDRTAKSLDWVIRCAKVTRFEGGA